ncbi:Por secretion system C-terminal sorting domain-containing protein [Reichenbachiella faecimaris]|uniref:Por secretion system C-terminal sorting domain-containing protein n=1 Tax=Reichenbachiella faecimaris TaxID=692418 RepID=A0A1W2G7F1_REIFA|nr:M43 family zinc metalloprotease [Reichenbachiella faecimaris]SMD32553.1 Por secretion system C-terminal sorting domain-containing protein [Reichenbachiella faecimaris]
MRGILSIMMTILLSFIINQQSLLAQTSGISCGTSQAMEELYKARPEAAKKAQEFNQFTKTFEVQQSAQRKAASGYTIPVVFHVFGSDFQGASVTQSIIEDALQKTNEDFNGLNPDYGDVSAYFSGRKSTLDIDFALAKIDPNGNATTGITFNSARSGFGNGGGYDSQIQQYAWDNNKYMNIYIMLDLYDDGATNNSGVAWYPDQWMTDNNLARVVYNGRYLGTNTSENFRRVLTHEFGHYLNLAHTFDNGCSAPGDHVSDTPSTTSNSGTCNYTVETCSGAGPANGENFMDYSECYRMFTQGQVARMEAALNHSARQPLWQASNLVATGVDGIGAHVLLASSSFSEDQTNDGTINGQTSITAENGASFAASGTLTEGIHYTTTNLPNGLNISITVTNSTTATFNISGAANNHSQSNSLNDLSVTFLDPTITGGANSLFSPTLTMSIEFIDPYQIVYEDMTDVSASASATWTYFTINTGGHAYGAWYDNGKLRLETYTKSMICEGSSRNLTKLDFGDPINATSNWVAGGAYPDEHDIRSNQYTVWDGSSGYLGFQVTNNQGLNINGWFSITVAANGNSFTIHDYAYNEDPNGTITAGQTTANTGNPPVAAFSASSTIIIEGESISFTDESTHTPTSWSWAFEGGTPATSTNQNPEVTYTTAGVYEVTLNASNSSGNDSITMTDYITVNEATGSAYCESAGSRVSYEWIANVTLNNFSNPSDAQLYSDFTNQTISITKGQSHAVALTPGFSGSAYNEYFKIWIDYNQDGDFEDAGEVAFDAGAASNTTVNGSIIPPTSALLGSTRMRVSMKYNSAPTYCGNLGDGEVEDYTVNISNDTTPPAEYCEVTNGAPNGQYIKRFQFGNIDNSSNYENGGYSDFTSQTTTIQAGSPTSMTITPHNTWGATGAKAWIDWNRDGDFNDANEEVLSGSGSGGSYSATVSVPAGAVDGITRLRIRALYSGTATPCDDEYFSEVEDYSIDVNTGVTGPTDNIGVYGNVKLYPNPFKDFIQLDLTDFSAEEVEITLFDLTGAIKYQQRISSTESHLRIGTNLEDGFYVLHVKTDQLREVHHIVKSDQ